MATDPHHDTPNGDASLTESSTESDADFEAFTTKHNINAMTEELVADIIRDPAKREQMEDEIEILRNKTLDTTRQLKPWKEAEDTAAANTSKDAAEMYRKAAVVFKREAEELREENQRLRAAEKGQ
ncbi:hypothetical protein SLS61_008925 [Didymella pomorum]